MTSSDVLVYMKSLELLAEQLYPGKSRWFYMDKALEYHFEGLPEVNTPRSKTPRPEGNCTTPGHSHTAKECPIWGKYLKK